MNNRWVIWVMSAGLVACGGGPKQETVPTGGGENTGAGEAKAAPTEVELDGQRWTLAAAGGAVERDGDYAYRVVTAGYTLQISPWPDSDAFVQTLAEHLAGYEEKGAFEVVHQQDGGRGNFEAVVTQDGKVDITVLIRPEPGIDGAMCGASLAGGTDWNAAATACRSLQRAE